MWIIFRDKLFGFYVRDIVDKDVFWTLSKVKARTYSNKAAADFVIRALKIKDAKSIRKEDVIS